MIIIKKIYIISIVIILIITACYIFKDSFAIQYDNYDYVLFNKDNLSELADDIKIYVSDIDNIIYRDSDYSLYDNLDENYEFMVNFALDYIYLYREKYNDKVIIKDNYKYYDRYHNEYETNEYIPISLIYDITNKFFGVGEFIILNDNTNIIDDYISLSSNRYRRDDMVIDSVNCYRHGDNIVADIKYINNDYTYSYIFKNDNNILKINNVGVLE